MIRAGVIGLEGLRQALGIFVPSHEQHSLLQAGRGRRVAQEAMKQISPNEQAHDDIERGQRDKKTGNRRLEFEDERESDEARKPDHPGLDHQHGHVPVTQQGLLFVKPVIRQHEQHQERAEDHKPGVALERDLRWHAVFGDRGIKSKPETRGQPVHYHQRVAKQRRHEQPFSEADMPSGVARSDDVYRACHFNIHNSSFRSM